MKKRHMAIGIETTGAPLTYIDIPSRDCAKLGAILPSSIPPIMQSPTQTVKYLSKRLVIFLSLDALLPLFISFSTYFGFDSVLSTAAS
jgi:hypothetical protein